MSVFGVNFLYIISLLFEILKIDTCEYLRAIIDAIVGWRSRDATHFNFVMHKYKQKVKDVESHFDIFPIFLLQHSQPHAHTHIRI